MKFLRTAILILAVLLCLAATAHACPGCKEALASGEGDIVRGYFWSILFMMSMPFLILGSFGIVIYRSIKKAQAASSSQASTQHGAAVEQREPVEV